MIEIFSWFSSNVGGLSIFGAAVAFSWSVFQYILERRRESHEKQFEAFHKLVKELVSPGEDGNMWIDRQAAIVFELRHFPRYYEFTERMLGGLRRKWEADPVFKWPRLLYMATKLMPRYPEPFVVSMSNHERLQIRVFALRQAQGERLFMRHYLCRCV